MLLNILFPVFVVTIRGFVTRKRRDLTMLANTYE
jgi:hypothetical protein